MKKIILLLFMSISISSFASNNAIETGKQICDINTNVLVKESSIPKGNIPYLCNESLTSRVINKITPVDILKKYQNDEMLNKMGMKLSDEDIYKLSKDSKLFDAIYENIRYFCMFIGVVAAFIALYGAATDKEKSLKGVVKHGMIPIFIMSFLYFFASGAYYKTILLVSGYTNGFILSLTDNDFSDSISKNEVEQETNTELKKGMLIGIKEQKNTIYYNVNEIVSDTLPVFGFDDKNQSAKQVQTYKDILLNSPKVEVKTKNNIKFGSIFTTTSEACLTFNEDHNYYQIDESLPKNFESTCFKLGDYNNIDSIISRNSILKDLLDGNIVDRLSLSSKITESIEKTNLKATKIMENKYSDLFDAAVSISRSVSDNGTIVRNSNNYKDVVKTYASLLNNTLTKVDSPVLNDDSLSIIYAIQSNGLLNVIQGFYDYSIKENQYENEKENGLDVIYKKLSDTYYLYDRNIACVNSSTNQDASYEMRKISADNFNKNNGKKYTDIQGTIFDDYCLSYDKETNTVIALGDPDKIDFYKKERAIYANAVDIYYSLATDIAIRVYNTRSKIDDERNFALFVQNLKKDAYLSPFLNAKFLSEKSIKGRKILDVFGTLSVKTNYNNYLDNEMYDFVNQKAVSNYKENVVQKSNLDGVLKDNDLNKTINTEKEESKDGYSLIVDFATTVTNEITQTPCSKRENGSCSDIYPIYAYNSITNAVDIYQKAFILQKSVQLIKYGVDTANEVTDSVGKQKGVAFFGKSLGFILKLSSVAVDLILTWINILESITFYMLIIAVLSVMSCLWLILKYVEPIFKIAINLFIYPIQLLFSYMKDLFTVDNKNTTIELMINILLNIVSCSFKIIGYSVILINSGFILNITMSLVTDFVTSYFNPSQNIFALLLKIAATGLSNTVIIMIVFMVIRSLFNFVEETIDRLTDSVSVSLLDKADVAIIALGAKNATGHTKELLNGAGEEIVDSGKKAIDNVIKGDNLNVLKSENINVTDDQTVKEDVKTDDQKDMEKAIEQELKGSSKETNTNVMKEISDGVKEIGEKLFESETKSEK